MQIKDGAFEERYTTFILKGETGRRRSTVVVSTSYLTVLEYGF